MAFNRNKFRGAKVTAQKTVISEALKESNNSNYVSFLDIKKGVNTFRLCPPHEPESPLYRNVKVHKLPIMTDEYVNGQPTGNKVLKLKSVFNAVVHGSLSKDPVDVYIKYLQEKANNVDPQESKSLYSIINGGYNDQEKWQWGIKAISSFVAYAFNSMGVFGKLDLKPNWIQRMDQIASVMEQRGGAMEFDPFSSPDNGLPLVIDFNPESRDKYNKYHIEALTPVMGEPWETFFERTKLTDAQLELLDSKKSLTEVYYNVYKKRDFNLAIEGLRRIDDKHKLGIFTDPSFIGELEEINKQIPDENSEQPTQPETQPAPAVSSQPQTNAPQPPVFGSATETHVHQATPTQPAPVAPTTVAPKEVKMTLPKMQAALKEYIIDNYGEQFVNQIPPRKKEVSEWYDMMMSDQDLPIKMKGDIEVPQPTTSTVAPVSTPAPTPTPAPSAAPVMNEAPTPTPVAPTSTPSPVGLKNDGEAKTQSIDSLRSLLGR